MPDQTSNDNDPAEAGSMPPDSQGQAALLLVESLMHGLIERYVISVADALEAVQTAADVSKQLAEEAGSLSASSAHTLLQAISRSLEHDVA